MKLSFNKYWILVSFITILNIFIFIIFSNKLENYVINRIMDDQIANK